jgi:thiamine pyrophosphokinase
MKNRCIIIAGAPVFSGVQPTAGDFIIAADSGYRHALSAGITPDLLVGDFDSLDIVPDSSIKTIRSPVMKNDTDTFLAIKHGLALGYKDFLLLGATGGRLDHQTANVAACAYIAEQGGLCEMRDSTNIIYVIKNRSLQVKRIANWSLSVFSYSEKAFGVTLTGLKYPLNNATLTNLFPLGVSNDFAAETATIEVKEGVLLIILSDMG